MTVELEILAELALDEVGIVVANNSARSTFTVAAGDCLLALDAGLAVAGRWPVEARSRGWHSTLPGRGLALISGHDEVRLVNHAGSLLWRFQHAPWAGAFESGSTWFDVAGRPYAVVPAPSYEGCLVVCLDLESGRLLAQAPVEAAPAGIEPVHHPDGWVGLSEGEGQDAVRAWWIRTAGHPPGQVRMEVLDAGWDDQVLSDVDSSGTKIITIPHDSGPLAVRSFPGLEVLRAIDPPGGHARWDFTACFAGDLLIGKLIGCSPERLVAVADDGIVCDLGEDEASWLIPASYGTWLAATRTMIRRCRVLVRR